MQPKPPARKAPRHDRSQSPRTGTAATAARFPGRPTPENATGPPARTKAPGKTHEPPLAGGGSVFSEISGDQRRRFFAARAFSAFLRAASFARLRRSRCLNEVMTLLGLVPFAALESGRRLARIVHGPLLDRRCAREPCRLAAAWGAHKRGGRAPQKDVTSAESGREDGLRSQR